MVQEKEIRPLAGGLMVALLLFLIPPADIYGLVWSAREAMPLGILFSAVIVSWRT